MQRTLACAAAVTFAAASLAAQQPSPFATRVVAFDTVNGLGGGTFDPGKALGRPAGALDVHSLGTGGFLTLGFDVVLVDGPGADLLVAENPFASLTAPWETYGEAFFVEVSTDGVHFARVPSRYTGPQGDPGAFPFLHTGWFSGLGGFMPVDPTAADPQDVVLAGGDAIDLADLRQHPLVVQGLVDLHAIQEVRLVDVRSGLDVDAHGVTIRDPSAGSADIDGVTVVQHALNQDPRGPVVELTIPADGDFTLTISDPDGLADLDPASFHAALWGIGIDPATLFQVAGSIQATPTSFTLRLGAPLPATIPLRMTVSVKDRAGNRSGASRTRD